MYNGTLDFILDKKINKKQAQTIIALLFHHKLGNISYSFCISYHHYQDKKTLLQVSFRSLSLVFFERLTKLNKLKFWNFNNIGIASANLALKAINPRKQYKSVEAIILDSVDDIHKKIVLEKYIEKNIQDKANLLNIEVKKTDKITSYRNKNYFHYDVIINFKKACNQEPILFLGVGHKTGAGFGFLRGVKS